MTKIATRLTDTARIEFLGWVNSVKTTRVSAEACLAEFEDNLGNNQAHYELGRFYTASGNPCTISFKDAELVWEDVDA